MASSWPASILPSQSVNNSTAANRRVACPTCGKTSPWLPENRFRPFCCERCKEIDLGAWASEVYRVPEADPAPGGEGEEH